MSRVYFYAIMPAAPAAPAALPRAFDVAGLWPADPQVRTITGGALAAVVGTSPPVDFRALPREQAVHYLLAHQRVVEAVMRTSAALPVKFGTTLPDEAAVVSLLMRGATLLAPPLAELSQHVQVELVVSWSIDDILRKIAAQDAVVRLKAQIGAQAGGVGGAGGADGATSAQRLAIGKLVKELIDRRREILPKLDRHEAPIGRDRPGRECPDGRSNGRQSGAVGGKGRRRRARPPTCRTRRGIRQAAQLPMHWPAAAVQLRHGRGQPAVVRNHRPRPPHPQSRRTCRACRHQVRLSSPDSASASRSQLCGRG